MDASAYGPLRDRGWQVLPGVFDAAECAHLREVIEGIWRSVGAPVPYDPGDRDLAAGVSLSSAGFVCRELLDHAPQVAALLDRPALLDVITGVLGPGAKIEGIAGNLNDTSRPFCFWHNHVGGIHAGHFRGLGVYPEAEPGLHRLVVVIYLDALSETNGEMLVWPRTLGEPSAPPHSDFAARTWSGQDIVHCEEGSLVLLDEYTWHAVRPQHRDGNRHYMGLYAVRPGARTTSFAVPRLPTPPGIGPTLAAMLSGHDGVHAPAAVARAARAFGEVVVERSSIHGDALILEVRVGEDAAVIEVRPVHTERPAFLRTTGMLVGYRGVGEAGPRCARAVGRLIEARNEPFDAFARALGPQQ